MLIYCNLARNLKFGLCADLGTEVHKKEVEVVKVRKKRQIEIKKIGFLKILERKIID